MRTESLLFILCLSVGAFAGETVINWELPTDSETCTNDPTPADPQQVRLYQLVATVTDMAKTEYLFTGLLPGDYTWASTSVRTDGAESRLSDAATKTITEMKVSNETVFTVVRTTEAFILLPTGTIPIGTVCDHNQSVNGHYAVPLDQVVWSTTAKTAVVVAECS